jgi:hypothetical protein
MWFGCATNLSKFSPAEKLIQVGPDTISPYAVVRELGVFFDSEVNMKSHISRTGSDDNSWSSLGIYFIATRLLYTLKIVQADSPGAVQVKLCCLIIQVLHL